MQALYPGMSEWRNPAWGRKSPALSANKSIVGRREPGELKHLSTQRKRDHSPSSGERTGNSPNLARRLAGGCRVCERRVRKWSVSGKVWESLPKRVRVP